MKKIFLGLCLAALGMACRASGASMSDTSCPNKDCADCTQAQMEDCSDCSGKSECSSQTDCSTQTECKSEQVCPVTGKSLD